MDCCSLLLFIDNKPLRTAIQTAKRQDFDFEGAFEVHQTPLDGQNATALGVGVAARGALVPLGVVRELAAAAAHDVGAPVAGTLGGRTLRHLEVGCATVQDGGRRAKGATV